MSGSSAAVTLSPLGLRQHSLSCMTAQGVLAPKGDYNQLMASVFRKSIQHRVPKHAVRKVRKDGVTVVSWHDRQHRRCVGTLAADGSGVEIVRYKSPTYFVRFKDSEGSVRVVNTLTSDKEQARTFLHRRQSEVCALRIDPDAAVRSKIQHVRSMRLTGLMDEYLGTLRDAHRASTESLLKRVIAHLGWRTVSSIDPARLECLRDELLDAHHDNRAINHSVLSRRQKPTLRNIRGFVVAAKGFCTWLAKKYQVPNRLGGVTCPKPSKCERRPRRAIEAAEFHSLIQAAEADVRDLHRCRTPGMLGRQAALIYSVLMFTGIRISALRRMCIGDVVFHDHELGHLKVIPKVRGRVAQQVQFRASVGGRLRDWIEIRRGDGSGDDDALIIWPARARDHFDRHCKDAGIDRRVMGTVVDIGALRGACNTHMFHAGVPAPVRARILGHVDTKLVETRYLLLGELAVNDAAARLEERLTAAAAGDSGAAAAA